MRSKFQMVAICNHLKMLHSNFHKKKIRMVNQSDCPICRPLPLISYSGGWTAKPATRVGLGRGA